MSITDKPNHSGCAAIKALPQNVIGRMDREMLQYSIHDIDAILHHFAIHASYHNMSALKYCIYDLHYLYSNIEQQFHYILLVF